MRPLRTSITRVELAADAIHRLALSPRGDAATIDALRALPDLQRWHPGLLDAAIDQLVTTGALAENSSAAHLGPALIGGRDVTVVFTVPGVAAPKGSRTVGARRDGTTYTRPASSREHAWIEAIARQAQWTAGQNEPPAAPYHVELTFYLARPKRPAHDHPSRADLDKLARAVLDGLVRGRVLTDDRHVVELVARKEWAATPKGECVHVRVETAAKRPRLEVAA